MPARFALPARPNLDHLRKQAKELLALARRGDPDALQRFRTTLPAADSWNDTQIASNVRLHDAQSVVAREYGFPGWTHLKDEVERRDLARTPVDELFDRWFQLVYGRGTSRPQPARAAEWLAQRPELSSGSHHIVACATGRLEHLSAAVRHDPQWVSRQLAPLGMPPLVAVTWSSLGKLPQWSDQLLASARLLLEAGADPNGGWQIAEFPGATFSALYGAAGHVHHPAMTRLLLEAGANPNDGESLYHSIESSDDTCTRLLLAHGATVPGSNALRHVLDYNALDRLQLLLAHGADPNEPGPVSPLLWALRRGRSLAHVEALLSAGADPTATTPGGMTARQLALALGMTAVASRLPSNEDASQQQVTALLEACGQGDVTRARELGATFPSLADTLSPELLRLLPEAASVARLPVVKAMLAAGWPIDVVGGDWNASALNHAAMNGDLPMFRFLLEQGANWETQHGFGDNVIGTLSWASVNNGAVYRDHFGCLRLLLERGVPLPSPDYGFPDEISDYLDRLRAQT